MKLIAVVVGLLAMAGLGLGACGALIGASGFGGGAPSATVRPDVADPAPTPNAQAAVAVTAVPPEWETIDRSAVTAECPAMNWGVLAAIGREESDSGRSEEIGISSGANFAGAEGPMQFEPATFAAYAVVGPGGLTPASPYNAVDAIYTAAHLLCADGAGSTTGTFGAIYAYDHTTEYVEEVLILARALAADPTLLTAPATALGFAAGQLGVPYLWGGTGPGGWDCSGLVQAAYRATGVALPRVAQTQFNAGPVLATGTPPTPGDLLFFGGSPASVSHVGIYLGTGLMIDAPYTGTVVRVDPVPTVDGTGYGTLTLIGSTGPT